MTVKQEMKLLKEYARGALLREYGFAPALNQIVLLETFFDGAPQYVLFRVGNHEYSFDGFTMEKRG